MLHTVWDEGAARISGVDGICGLRLDRAGLSLTVAATVPSTGIVLRYRALAIIHRRCALMLQCTLSKADNSRLDLSVSWTGSSLPDCTETPSQQGSRPPIDI